MKIFVSSVRLHPSVLHPLFLLQILSPALLSLDSTTHQRTTVQLKQLVTDSPAPLKFPPDEPSSCTIHLQISLFSA